MVFLVLLNAFLSEDLLRRKSLECLVNLKGQNCKKRDNRNIQLHIQMRLFFLIWARLKLFVRKHIKRKGTKSETNQTFKMGWNPFWSTFIFCGAPTLQAADDPIIRIPIFHLQLLLIPPSEKITGFYRLNTSVNWVTCGRLHSL